MPVTDGHITAPFGLAAVARTLGENKLDTQSLCCSPKINPYSLIRPLFRGTGVSGTLPPPGTAPSWFATVDTLTGPQLFVVPASQRARLFPTGTNGTVVGINLKDKTSDEYPCKDDYDFTYPVYINYAVCKWGFIVPYVSNQADIFALRDLVWERFGPADSAKDTKGLLTETRAELQQFDGYLHDAVPADPLKAVQLEYGKPISATPDVSVGNYTDAQVLGTSGKAHPGGVVSIPAVIGVGGQYGMTIFRRPKGEKKYKRIKSVLGGKIEASGGGLKLLTAMQISDYPASEADWIIIPWVAQGGTVSVDASGELKTTGSPRFYSFRFDSRFQGYASATIVPKVIDFGNRIAGTDIYEFSRTSQVSGSNDIWEIVVRINNANPGYPLTARNFYLEVSYQEQGKSTKTVKRFGSYWADYGSQNTGLSVTALGGADISFSTGTVGSDKISVSLTPNSPMPFVVCSVRIRFPIPVQSQLGGTKSPSLERVCFTSEDKNHSSRTINVFQTCTSTGQRPPLIKDGSNLTVLT